MRLKREFVSRTGYKPHNFTSINRCEKIPFLDFEQIETYSEGKSLEIFDPRSNRMVGHYFNPRIEALVRNVIVEPKQGLIYTKEGKLISESTNWSTSNLYESFPWNPKRVNHVAPTNLVINLTSSAFGHWLVEDVASSLYLIEKHPEALILVSKKRSRFITELLEFLGREYIESDGPIRVPNLLTVTHQNDSGWMHPRDLQILEKFKMRIPGETTYGKRIYASRRSLKRSPSNEKEIESLFRDLGFEVLQLENMDLVSEINLMKGVQDLAGVSGSWQFNIIWADKAQSMFDIVNENYWTELAHRVCGMKNVKYNWKVYEGDFNRPVNYGSLKHDLLKIYS
jgi:hypothetical protein